MIRQFFIAILLLGPLLLSAQKSTRLSGQLMNAEVDQVTLIGDPLHLDSEAGAEIPLKDGMFTYEIKANSPLALTLKVSERRIPIFVIPGEALGFKLDLASESKQEIEFSDAGATYNQYLQQFHADHGDLLDVAATNARLMEMAIDPWELLLYQEQRKMTKSLDIEFKDSDYPQEFQDFLRHEVAFLHDRWMLAYPIVRAEADAKQMTVKHLPRTHQNEIAERKLVKPEALVSPVYRDYVWYAMVYFTSEQNSFAKFTDHNKSVLAKFDYASEHLSDRVQTWYVSKLLANNCGLLAPGTIERLETGIKKGDGGADYLKPVQAICEEAQKESKLAEASAPEKKTKKNNKRSRKNMAEEKYDFRMVDLEGKEMHLSDFKGKVVYIDFWASWCGPCRSQMPFSKKLHHRIEEDLGKKEAKDIVFLYISIDQDENSWKNGIQAMQIEGTHGFSNARWPDGAGQFFQIPGIPRYMIMDKNGDIVNQNAPRPSMDGIFEELKNLAAE